MGRLLTHPMSPVSPTPTPIPIPIPNPNPHPHPHPNASHSRVHASPVQVCVMLEAQGTIGLGRNGKTLHAIATASEQDLLPQTPP